MTTSNERTVRFELPDNGAESPGATLEESPPVPTAFDSSQGREDEISPSMHPPVSALSEDALEGPSQGELDSSPGTEEDSSVCESAHSSVSGSAPSAHAQTSLCDERKEPKSDDFEKNDGKSSNDAILTALQVLFYECLESKPNTISNYNTKDIKASMRKKLFGLTKGLSTTDSGSNNPFNYEQKYPRDQPLKELDHDARVWLTYLDEANLYDREKVEGWKDTVDVLLVFAALFSGVITTFISQASQNLQQNYSQVSASLLFQMAQVQLAQFNGTPITINLDSTLTPNSQFRPSTNALLVNGLWFTSLAVSLSTALVAVLTKQWLYYYMSTISGTALEKTRVRHFRFRGLELWKVSLIIDLLPILLYLALGIFLIGIIIFLFPLDPRIAWVTTVITGITFTLYFISVMLPIRHPDCPYTTSLTIYVGNVYYFLLRISHGGRSMAKVMLPRRFLNWRVSYRARISYWSGTLRKKILVPVSRHLQHSCSRVKGKTHKLVEWLSRVRQDSQRYTPSETSPNWKERNLKEAIEKCVISLDCEALHWLYTISSNPSVHRIIAQGLSVHPAPNEKVTSMADDLRSTLGRYPETDPEDPCCFLCLELQTGSVYDWYSRAISDAKKAQPEYQSFSHIARSVRDKNYVQILKDAFKDDTLKLPLTMWRVFLKRASKDATLVAHILDTRDINPFNWNDDPAYKTKYDIGLVRVGTKEQQKWIFDYLFRYFCEGSEPNYSRGSGSLETRYLLLVSIYRTLTGLTSDRAVIGIINKQQKGRSLENLFWNFYYQNGYEWNIPSTFFLPFYKDILSVDAFWKEPMTGDARKTIIQCLDGVWQRTDTDLPSNLPFTQCPDLSAIIRWCSGHGIYIRALMDLVLIPQRHVSLLTLLSTDPDITSSFSYCLELLRFRYQPDSKRLEFLCSNLVDLFRSADPTLSLFNNSVLLGAWKLFVFEDFSPKEFLRIVKSKLDQRRRVEVRNVMRWAVQQEQDVAMVCNPPADIEHRAYADKLRVSLVYFERITSLTRSNLKSTIENPAPGWTAERDDDTEAYLRERNDNGMIYIPDPYPLDSHNIQHMSSRPTANWIKKVFGFVRPETSVTKP